MVKKFFSKFFSSFIFVSAGIFTLLFFSPLEVYLGNPTDFRIYIDYAVLILALVSLAVSIVISGIISFLPKKILNFLNISIFGITVCYYIQLMFLNGEMSILTGESFNVSKSTKLVNLFIWLIILLSVFVAWLLFKKFRDGNSFISLSKFISIALVVMQVTGFLSLYLTYDRTINESKSLYYSIEGQLEVSEKNNVLYFIVDYCDSTIIDETLKEDPNLFDYFDGFTYYPDNVFVHSRSYPAITYLLSGEKCYFDIPYNEYVDNALKNSSFMKSIDDMGTDIRLYTDPRFSGIGGKGFVDNLKSLTSASLSSVKIKGFLEQSVKVSAFRGMPYAAKSRFFYDVENVNEKSLVLNTDFAPINNDLEFYYAIQNKGVSINKSYDSAFRFYHMFGSHPGAYIDENADYLPEASLTQALRGDFKIIKTYIEQLKALGVYDKTTIIITADHGEFKGYFAQPQTCLFMIKEAGADTTKPMKTSDAPITQEDIFPTVIKALGGDYKEFGRSVDEIDPSEIRKRYHYNTEVDLSTGFETFLREYLVEGDGRMMENYTPTGREWKVKSSISPH